MMVLDLEKLELRFSINDTDYGCAFKIRKATYRAAVCLNYVNSSILLLKYDKM